MLFCNDAGCFAADPDGAGGRYEKTVNDLQESGFSTSVWSEQTDDPAAFQSEVHIAQSFGCAEILAQILCFK